MTKAVLFILLGWAAEAGEPLSLAVKFEELPRLIGEQNRLVRASRADLGAAETRTGALTRAFLPKLELRGGQETHKVGSLDTRTDPYWKAQAELNLYRGGRDRIESKQRLAERELAEASLSMEHKSELEKARKLYWQIAAFKELIAIQTEAIKANDEHLKAAKRKGAAGIATRADPLEFEMNRTLLEQDLKKLRLELDLAKNKLAVLIARDDHERFDVTTPLGHPPENEYQEANPAIGQVSDVRLLESRVSISKLESSKFARWWLPRVDLYGGTGLLTFRERDYAIEEDRREWFAGVKIELNFFDGLVSQNESRAKAAQAEGLRLRTEHRAHELAAQLHELKHDLRLQHDLLHDSGKTIEQAKQFLKLTLNEYGRGVKNGPDVLNAAQKYLEFQRNDIELRREYYWTQAEMLSVLEK
ncbi:MAG TPA: TolC family protein [Bdellovibrionales bacterium]|nr:TolC family protein [Bdellovibrionales bacterium]